ncbi:MAG: phosphoribosylformylglycinamidine synthase [Clostridiales Family XIII bacterium]|jgi:phosphoribosylformylglycinamidine synthase|nr:phosphoribosylformylglycinamidine synthase [Clostridiales Family XIII bacterium]
MVKRIYVEKKRGFDVEAQKLLREIRENLSIRGLKSLRIVNRYDVENISGEAFEVAKKNIFSEPNPDIVYDENENLFDAAFSFGVEYLPGQYDQRADSAAQCIKLVSGDSDVIVRYSKWMIIDANLTDEEKKAIKKYCINPVDSREAPREKPAALGMELPEPHPVETVDGFRNMDERGLRKLIERMGFAMSYSDLKFVREHFHAVEHRDPTVTELRVIDTYWSDHCRHTTFLTSLNEITFEDGDFADMIREAFDAYLDTRRRVYGSDTDRDVSLMDMATIGAKYLKKQGKLNDLDESEEINACSIRVKARVFEDSFGKDGTDHEPDGVREEDWLVMFKNETHNHPTEIEPFGGAATCLGGAIRDPLSGRAYVYQAMRVTGSGDPRTSMKDTLPGKLSQYQITRGAAKGYSSYGNQVGLATGFVDEIYDEGYVAKRMEIGAVVGATPADHVRRERPASGDIILIVGGRTGRDGLGGATGSSKEHNEESILTAGAEVQKGNPPVERNIQRLFRRKEVTRLIKRCNDFGAGGVSVAIGELADSIDVNLDKIPKKYDGLDGTELAISESQERMAVVIEKGDLEAFARYACEENVEVTAVAKVTDSGRFRMTWRGDTVLDLSRQFLDTNGVNPQRAVHVKNRDIPVGGALASEQPGGFIAKDELLAAIDDLNACGKKGLIECFDSTIGRGSVLMPLGGATQMTPTLGMAAKLPVRQGDTDTITLMTYGFDAKLAKQSPYHAAIYAVLDSVTKIVGMGGDMTGIRLTFQEYFEKLGKVPTRWAKPFMAMLGALKAQLALELPAIGGKDSMSGTFSHLDVPPTLVSFAVAVSDAGSVLSPEFKQTGDTLILIHTDKDARGIPDFEQFKLNMKRINRLTREGKIRSAATIGRGGIFASIAKMALGNSIGAIIRMVRDEELIAPDYGSLIVEVDGNEDGSALLGGLDFRVIGETVDSGVIEVKPLGGANARPNEMGTYDSTIVSLREIERRWQAPLERVFPTTAEVYGEDETEMEELIIPAYTERKVTSAAGSSIARPRVFIPVFPGTNCEADTQAAFERAGAEARVVNLINMNENTLDESIRHMTEVIGESQIIALPGGFSGGDEPEGSAKFITAVFRNPFILEAVTELLEHRDGLILGICNGFQALIKLGLLPYGRITEPDEHAPTLTYNTIGRHVSSIVRTRVSSVLSPWLARAEVGDVFTTPVSHGEGRFVASDDVLESLIAGGQIATQYADLSGNPTMAAGHNPNGSRLAVEGITSPDGRVFGKMGHVERVGRYLYKNVPGNYDTGIFESGVAYFE